MKKYLLALVFTLSHIIASATVASIADVKHLGRADGLSSQRVFTILEDNDGVLWFSTRSGVDRYNGRTIKNYDLKGDFFYGDLAGRVIMLAKDSDGSIIAYDNIGRIYKYSPVFDRFDTAYKLSDDIPGFIRLNKYLKGKNNTEYFGLTQGLFARSSGEKSSAIIPGIDVNDIIEIDNSLFIATTSGLVKREANGKTTRFSPLEGNNIQTLFYFEQRKMLFAGTFNDGLWVIDLPHASLKHIDTKNEIFTNPIRAMQKIDEKTIGVGIDGGGIYAIDVDSHAIDLVINSGDDLEFSLQGNGIYTMYIDSQANIWAGSYTGGVARILFYKLPFKNIGHEKGNKNSLANNNVNAITENSDGAIWYATDRGVSIHKGNQWTHALKGIVGLSIHTASGGNILLGTYGEGVFLMDSNGNVKKRITKQSGQLTSNYIFCINCDNDGDYWLGALDGHLMHLDQNLNKIATYPISIAHSIEVIDQNRVAVATVDGFYIVDKSTKAISHYAYSKEQVNNDVSAYIVPMLANSDGTIWLGTEGGGLNLYDPAKRKTLRSYKIADGLPSNDIFGLQRDNMGRLWISTGNGIAILNDSVFSSLNYLNSVASEYNKNAAAKIKSGDLIFGSTSGAMIFMPSEINVLNYKAPLRITGFVVDDPDLQNDDSLKEKLYRQLEKGEISLSYANNSFSVAFESIDHRYQEDIGYSHMLEGYDKGWSQSQTSGEAAYKYVMPGDYTLRLRAISLCDGTVIDERAIKITVAEPWWNSWWAWIVDFLIIGLITYLIIRYKFYRLQKKQDAEKIRFFVNTAHDIRTPVTLALAPLEDLERDEPLSDNAAYLLNMARQNIRKLNSITSQLLEFERYDSNRKVTKPVPVDLRDILKGEIACFSNVCQKKNIRLSLSVPDEPASVKGDIELLEMIFDNILSNACKYTRPGGFVEVRLTAQGNKVTAQIADNGIGIPANERKHIFADIYRAQNARESQEVGTGFGLLQVKRVVKLLGGTISFKSAEGEGTTFTVAFDRTFEKAEAHERKNPTDAMLTEVVPAINVAPEQEMEPKDSTLLIVEDHDDLRNYLAKLFSRDYNVVLKPTADDALEYLTSGYPDLIISDVMMPGIQGDDFCNRVKNSPETAGIPVILLTAKNTHESIVEGFSKGADDYVAKPFSSEILKLKVKGLLENRNRLRNFLLQQAMQQATNPSAVEQAPAEAAPSESDTRFMQKVTALVIGNIADTEFSIDALCREMAMSRTLFYGRLKALTGKAPQEFIRLLKLERAAELLRQGESVNDVAESTGFGNVKYFSTVFKKHFGVQPSKYLKV